MSKLSCSAVGIKIPVYIGRSWGGTLDAFLISKPHLPGMDWEPNDWNDPRCSLPKKLFPEIKEGKMKQFTSILNVSKAKK